MEPVTYLAHRFVMHGVGLTWHRSHHRPNRRRRPGEAWFERNDRFPVLFAAVTVVAVAVGLNVSGLGVLVPVAVGVTLYGAAYAYVHDGVVHGRFPVPVRGRALDELARRHGLHHRFGGEPYGMLVPVVPAALRRRVERAERVGAVPGP